MFEKKTRVQMHLKDQPVPEGEHLLEVDDLKMYFHTQDGVVKAVDGVSYTLDRGETLGVVGESGSGKSVTHLTIMGLIDMPPGRIEGGDVRYRGQSLLKMSEEQMQDIRGNDIAMIFQDPMTSLNPVYTIGRQLGEGMRLHRGYSKDEALKRSIELLDMVGIPNPEQRVKDYPHQFSGGMRQRVMIAMALACNPKLLIADEPTTALDVTIQAQILDLLRRLREDTDMAVLLITHDLGVVSEIADRVVVMYCGQVVEEAEVRLLFDNPMHPYTLGLLKSIPRLEDDDSKRLYMIKGMVPNPLEMPPGCHFSDRCDSCMQVCRERMPELVQVGDHKVRCFLYEEQDGHAKDAAEVKANEEKAREAVEAAREVSTAEALIEGDVARETEEGGADER